MPKYVAKRKDVCAGQLLKSLERKYIILDSKGNEISKEQLDQEGIKLTFYGGYICRGMLYKIDDYGLAQDLIYNTPSHYPISEENKPTNSEFVITHHVELDELLKYLRYREDLTANDLKRIHRKLIEHNWWLKHNMELFGWKKLDTGSYCSGGVETIPMDIFTNLNQISCSRKGQPHQKEPGYELIRKLKY